MKQSAKSVLISLGLIAEASATNAAIQKKRFGSGMATLIMSNKKQSNHLKNLAY